MEVKGIRHEAFDCEKYVSGKSMEDVMADYGLTSFCHYYVSIIVKYNLKSKQISIKINRFFYIRNHNKYISKFHFFIFLSLNLLSL